MKNTSTLFLLIIFIASTALAQSPFSFNYQAVIRDNKGLAQSNKDISMKITILQYEAVGIFAYEEKFYVQTNEYGLINLEIGNGVNQIGNLGNIDWSDGPYFLQTAIDTAGGLNFIIMGTSQLLSVPYAMHARTVEIDNVDDGDINPYNEIQSLYLNNNTLSIENGNSVDLNSLSRWDINGNDIFYNDGKVGIGTSAPSSLLSIEKNAQNTQERTFLTLRNKSTGTHSYVSLKLYSGSSAESVLSMNHHSNSYTAVPDHHEVSHIWNVGRGLALRSTGPEACIRFQTSSVQQIVERMRLDNRGYLGIGTSSPESKLQISDGDVYIDNPQKGIIMKSTNGQCWRMTVDNNGNPVFNAINCP